MISVVGRTCFPTKKVNDVVNWRLYHLQKASKTNMKRTEAASPLHAEPSFGGVTWEIMKDDRDTPSIVVNNHSRPYDPVKDLS